MLISNVVNCIGKSIDHTRNQEKEEDHQNIDIQNIFRKFIIVRQIIGVRAMNIVLFRIFWIPSIGQTLMKGIGIQTTENFRKLYLNTLTEGNLLSIFLHYRQKLEIIK